MELQVTVTEAEIREAVGTYMRSRMRDWAIGTVNLSVSLEGVKSVVTATARATPSLAGGKD